jgi:hypothetical protein
MNPAASGACARRPGGGFPTYRRSRAGIGVARRLARAPRRPFSLPRRRFHQPGGFFVFPTAFRVFPSGCPAFPIGRFAFPADFFAFPSGCLTFPSGHPTLPSGHPTLPRRHLVFPSRYPHDFGRWGVLKSRYPACGASHPGLGAPIHGSRRYPGSEAGRYPKDGRQVQSFRAHG